MSGLILFINGPFGVGKTTVAKLIQSKVHDSLIFDPEEVGSMLHMILSELEPVNDFQDYALWRHLVPIVAERLQSTYKKSLIIPMTVWRPDYFEEILAGLRSFAETIHVYTLIADVDVLQKRIMTRNFAREWSLNHLSTCLESFGKIKLRTTIDTSTLSPADVADLIITGALGFMKS